VGEALLVLNGMKADQPEIRQAVNRNDIAAGLSVYAVKEIGDSFLIWLPPPRQYANK
jgi:hypothetical protein